MTQLSIHPFRKYAPMLLSIISTTRSWAWSSITAAPAYLDPVAALALQMLDGTASVADLIADVHEVLGIPKAVARSQLRRAISLLDDGGLLTSSTAPESPATDSDLFPAPPNP